MRKHISTRKFSRTSNERKQLFRNLIRSLVLYGVIETSEAKAKSLRPQVEKLVTLGKIDSLTTMKQLVQKTGDVQTAKGLLEAGKVFKNRPGGYIRLLKLGTQRGDDSLQVRMEWVEQVIKPEIVSATIVKEPKAAKKTETVIKTVAKLPKKTGEEKTKK